MRIKVLSILLFLALFLATPGGPGAAQAPAPAAAAPSEEEAAAAEEALEEFVPSEEVPADAGISFPVDI